MAIKCPKCQTNNPETAKFCSECAKPLLPSTDIEITKTMETAVEEYPRGSILADRYKIIEKLGIGGMGAVYRVEDTNIGQDIALKLIKPDIASDKRTLERFRNELKTTRMISHRNVCRMFDLAETEGTYYITMEYVAGEDLKIFIRRSGRLDIPKAISIAKEICEGLGEAHGLGVVHRDLKSSNIMIDKDGKARIMDFGIARSQMAKGITDEGIIIGTPEYMSPEQAEAKEVDHRSDIYSLGVILYEMVTGYLPFEGDTPLSIALKHKGEIPNDPNELNTQISDGLNRLILRCLEKEKNKRYQNSGEVLSALENVEDVFPTKEGIGPERKPITSKEITVKLSPKKIFVPALVVMVLTIAVIIWSPWGHKETASIAVDKPSIAILPFDDLSPQKDQEYLCTGFADELINRLAKIDRIKVPARTSAFSLKGKALSIQEIGKILLVENVLEGSIRKAENKLRITVQLVKTADGFPIWSEKYERDDTDIFALQDAISLAIVDNLKITLLGKEKAEFEKSYTQNQKAYDLYLQGRFFWWKRTEDGFNKALEYFAQAIEMDPDYALAHIGLADTYTMLNNYGMISTGEVLSKIRAGVKKALEIDDSLAEAHTSMGNIKMFYDLDWEGAKEEFRSAIKLNPNYLWAHLQYVDCLFRTGQFDRAFEEIKPGYELDPLNIVVNYQMGYVNYHARRYNEAEEVLKRVIAMDPNFHSANIRLGSVYLQQSRYNEALAEFQKVIDNTKGRLSNAHYFYCVILAKMGKQDEAEKRLEELFELSKQKNLFPAGVALVYAALDQKDKAFEWLRKAFEEEHNTLRNLKVDPMFDGLRTDPRFTDLLRKMGLE